MIGKHIVEQPFHQTIKQYRLIAIMITYFIGYMMLKAWNFFELNHNIMSVESAAGFFTYVAALLGALITCLNNIKGKHEP